MANKMLIDASHPEETRVVVVRGSRVEEFDFESANRRPLRGNIYLAKVIRVEPSLQAAFVDYGGNRHGFLAFSEIHPDYYQIPVADRQALLEEEARHERDAEHDEERAAGRRGRRRSSAARARDRGDTVASERQDADETSAPTDADPASPVESDQDGSEQDYADGVETEQAGHDHADDAAETLSAGEEAEERPEPVDQDENGRDDVDESGDDNGYSAEALGAEAPEDENGEADGNGEPAGEEQVVEDLGGGDALEEVSERRHRPVRRHYKIQEVIKRRQILLVQVVKEERGNKGAAMTTYLSLAGRYSVLMPNTARGGGISRKITSAEDRKRLKEVAQDLEVPQGMGIILRTAGASRTKPEIKRDYEYLMRLWESVRELTLKSSAPALVYEEGSLIKRAIRDLYNKEIDEILVAGEEGYREAKDFMRMLMPSHAKAVQLYKEEQPLFAKYGIEAQLDAMFSSQVQLKSGGYLVINPTEALVSIDVNSGRSTREHNIEDTALRTNLEASEEIARQLRLRDLAGLIVIDFIDMEEKRNNRAVEKRLKDSLKNDRARIQVGHISPFGLMEMSRQRIRTGVLESSSIPCPHCAGTGVMRATPSVALHLLRTLEETLIRSAANNLVVRTREEAAFYVLNHKRTHLHDLESRFGVRIDIVPDGSLSGMTVFAVDRGEPATRIERKAPATGVQIDAIAPLDETDSEIDESGDETAEADADAATETNGDGGRRRRRRRRRRGRGGEGREESFEAGAGDAADEGEQDDAEDADEPDESGADHEPLTADTGGEEGEGRRRERRGRRRGRGRGRNRDEAGGFARGEPRDEAVGVSSREEAGAEPADEQLSGAASRRDRAETPIAVADSREPAYAERANGGAADEDAAPAADSVPEPAAPKLPEPEPVAVVLTPPDPDRPKRAGWWSKAKSVLSGS
jgi:ribonuclease E